MSDNINFCSKCGVKRVANAKYCGNCGHEFMSVNTSLVKDISDKQNNKVTGVREDNNSASGAKSIDDNHVIFTSKSHGNHRHYWIVSGLIAVGLLVILMKPWVPRGLDTAEEAFQYSDKYNDDISTTRLIASLDEGMVNGKVDRESAAFAILKNDKSNTFVFKQNDHYVYVVRIFNNRLDSYNEEATAIRKDKNGKIYHKQLSRKQMDKIDADASEAETWTDSQYYAWIHKDN